MGVEGLFKVTVHSPNSKYHGKTIQELGHEIELKGLRRVAVDASNLIYRAFLGMQHIASLTDKDGQTTVHINTIWAQLIMLEQDGVGSLWVFDNPKVNPDKAGELANRKAKKEAAAAKGKEKSAFTMTSKHVEDVKTLLNGMGVPWVEAPEGIEAEEYAAILTRGPADKRPCDYVLSNDSDVLMFGGSMLRTIKVTKEDSKTAKTVYIAYNHDEILVACGLKRDQFVRLCVALGTDFNTGIAGCGPKTSMKKLKLDMINFDVDLLSVYKKILSDKSDRMMSATIHQEPYSRDRIKAFLLGKNFKEERVDQRLRVYERYLEKRNP